MSAKVSSSDASADATLDPQSSARSAGLRYLADDRPGIARKRRGKGFRYERPDGSHVAGEEELCRIRALAIPPAWTHVWISPHPLAHLQATGRDAKGRKQYRYHARWREIRDENKYGRLEAFGTALGRIRECAARDLARTGLPREKVIATVVQLLDRTLIRIGNEEYARANDSFGLTTLRERHVTIEGTHLQFHFRGKSGKVHLIDVRDPRLARIVKTCQELPGQELFHFRDDEGALHPVESTHVNSYLSAAAGDHFTAKDFRTWHGTLLAACALAERAVLGPPTKKHLRDAVVHVAAKLGNTPAVCQKSYVHPVVIALYLRGDLPSHLGHAPDRHARESALLAILRTDASSGQPSRTAHRPSRRKGAWPENCVQAHS